MFDLNAFFKICGAVAIAGVSIGMAVVAVRQLMTIEAARRARVEKRIKIMIDYSEFSEKQKYWLINSAASKMVGYQLVGRASSARFYALNEAAIVILGLNIAIPAIIAAFWPGQAMHGLAVIAICSAVGVMLTGWDKLEQNSSRWQDYHEIASLIEDALDELLTDTPQIPLETQFNQFVVEYREICKLERDLQRKRVNAAQETASEQAESIKSGITKSREEYRAKYEPGDNALPNVDVVSGSAIVATDNSGIATENAGSMESSRPSGKSLARLMTLPSINAVGTGAASLSIVDEQNKVIEGTGGMTRAQYVESVLNSGNDDDEEPLSEAW